MSTTIEPLEQIQDFVVGRVMNDVPLANVVVLEERKGVFDNDLTNVLASQTLRGGKKGAAILMEIPEFDVLTPNAVTPNLDLVMTIRCIEKPLVNRGTGGAGISAEAMAMRVIQILHHFIMTNLPLTIVAKKGQGATYEGGERERAVLIGGVLQLGGIPKTPRPIIAGNSSIGVTITGSATSTIYYTTDGTYPSPTNGTAVAKVLLSQGGDEMTSQSGSDLLSQNPIDVASGTLVLAVAYPSISTHQASDLASLIIS